MENANNSALLIGTLASGVRYSHSGRGEDYYTFSLEVERLSGAYDTLNVIVREELLQGLHIEERGKIRVSGEVRSFNNKSGVGSKLIITVFAREICFCDDEDENEIVLSGTICKTPNYRSTPMGRQICDIMLAVGRRYGRSDYLPCIVWGRVAERASLLTVGDRIELRGRLQSRRYIKSGDTDAVERTAFEVSASEMSLL